MINMVNPKQRDRARSIFQELGSIKRAARAMKCSKAEIKKFLGKEWLEEQRTEDLNKRKASRQSSQQTPTNFAFFQQSQPSRSKTGRFVAPGTAPARKMNASGTLITEVRTEQRIENFDKVFPTNRGVFEVVTSLAWGRVLVPVADPRFREVTSEEVKGIKLPKNFPRIPAPLWASWIDLCFHLCHDMTGQGQASRELEVEVLLCRKTDDLSQWRMVIPKQRVSGGAVNAEINECIDIVTGEKFDYFPPPGWSHAGTSHSHNTMEAFFSPTDNNSEISIPGLHIVVGRINKKTGTYTEKSSIVLRQLRKHVNFDDVVDATPVDDAGFHPDVLDYVSTSNWHSYTSYISAGPTRTNTTASKESALQDDCKDFTGDDVERWRRFWNDIDNDDLDDARANFNSMKKELPSAAELLAEEDEKIEIPHTEADDEFPIPW